MKEKEDIEEAVQIYEETLDGKREGVANKQVLRERLRALYWVLEQKEKEKSLKPPTEELFSNPLLRGDTDD